MFWAITLCILSSAAVTAAAASGSDVMILPLFYNKGDHRRSREDFYNPRRRRHLRGTPNARMPLHDDLELNGYYTTRVGIGTPPQEFALIVDSGSTATFVPCSTCEQCGIHQNPKFRPESSSTYEPVKCNSNCICDKERKQCTYERVYTELSTSSGVLGKDVMSFGNQSELKPQRVVFGCENMETGDIYSQNADGIIGLGRGDLSIMDKLVAKRVIDDSFSLCYGGMDVGGGAMVLGGISPPVDMVFTRSDPKRSPYYNIELKEIHVAGKKLPLDPRIFDGKRGTVLDSGTTYSYLPKLAFGSFKEAIIEELNSLKRIRGPDPSYDDICFSGATRDLSQLSKTFPSVEMVFANEQKLLLSPENYLFRHSKVNGAYCLGIFENGRDTTTLLGGITVRNTLVTYDRGHEKIGFWKTNCSKLWEQLRLSNTAPSPLPSRVDETNATMGISPISSPTTSPSMSPSGTPPLGASMSPPLVGGNCFPLLLSLLGIYSLFC